MDIVVERRIAADPSVVWELVSDARAWAQWQGSEAEIDPVPGGVHRVKVTAESHTAGQIVELDPPRRISFTWGFDVEGHPLPAASTLVVIDLIPDGNGTLVRLTQQRVPDDMTGVHDGWTMYLDRLATVAEGGDPGPDPNLAKAYPDSPPG